MGPLTPIIGLRLLALAAGLRHNAEIGQPGLCFSAYGHKFGINHLDPSQDPIAIEDPASHTQPEAYEPDQDCAPPASSKHGDDEQCYGKDERRQHAPSRERSRDLNEAPSRRLPERTEMCGGIGPNPTEDQSTASQRFSGNSNKEHEAEIVEYRLDRQELRRVRVRLYHDSLPLPP